MGQYTGGRLAIHFKDVIDSFELTDGCLNRIITDIGSSNYSMTRELQLTLKASGIEGSESKNHIPRMAHIIPLAVGGFMSSLGVKGCTKSWEANVHD
jgi:hypothetical protein